MKWAANMHVRRSRLKEHRGIDTTCLLPLHKCDGVPSRVCFRALKRCQNDLMLLQNVEGERKTFFVSFPAPWLCRKAAKVQEATPFETRPSDRGLGRRLNSAQTNDSLR